MKLQFYTLPMKCGMLRSLACTQNFVTWGLPVNKRGASYGMKENTHMRMLGQDSFSCMRKQSQTETSSVRLNIKVLERGRPHSILP